MRYCPLVKQEINRCIDCNLCDELKEQPQIVRCKDCKHGWNINPSEEEKFYVCQNPKMVNMRYSHQGNWFCADGERR